MFFLLPPNILHQNESKSPSFTHLLIYKKAPPSIGRGFLCVLDATFYSDGGAKSGQHGDKDLNHQSYDFLLSHRLKSLEYPPLTPPLSTTPGPSSLRRGNR